MEHELWNLKVKEYNIVAYTHRVNELAFICPRIVEPERVKVDPSFRGLTDKIKGDVTSSKRANLNKAESFESGNSSGKSNHKDNSRQISQNNQKQENARAMERHKERYWKEKNVATGENALPILTCYDCGEQGHTRNRCPKKVKQEEVREVCVRAYAIKDAEPKGLNMVNGTFLLNNRYALVLFDSGSDRSLEW
nr:hypothetical protein [Tanacetum cinerariifolium]